MAIGACPDKDVPNFVEGRGILGSKLSWSALRRFRPGASLHKRHDAALSGRLLEIAASLSGVTVRTEPDFLELARRLQNLYACASEIGRSVGDRLNSVRDSLQNSSVRGQNGLANRSVQELHSGLDEAAQNLNALSQIEAGLGSLQRQAQAIDRVARFLNASASGFAVESARTPACFRAFGPFVDDFRQLPTKIRALAADINQQAQATQSDLSRTNDAMKANLAQLRQLTGESEAELQQTSGGMQSLIESSWRAVEQSQGHIRQIAAHAEDAVYYLQFGDIVRQKLEHVVTSLEEAAQVAKRLPAAPPEGGQGSSEAAQAFVSLTIQVNQIESIAAELAGARTKLSSAFDGLGQEAGELVQSIGRLSNDDPGRGDVFEELKSSLLRLSDLHGDGQSLRIQARDASRHAIEASSALSRHLSAVEEINHQMHLQALNAIIKTEWLGVEGQTLGVLSQHVHSVFRESSEVVQQTVGVLEQITGCTLACDGAEAENGVDLKGELQESLRQISELTDDFRQTSASASELAGRQGEAAGEAHARLEFISSLEGQLAEVRGELAAMARGLEWANTAGAAEQELLRVSDRYTMESEREIHRRLMSQTAAPEITAPSPNELDADMASTPAPASDYGDNVELF